MISSLKLNLIFVDDGEKYWGKLEGGFLGKISQNILTIHLKKYENTWVRHFFIPPSLFFNYFFYLIKFPLLCTII